MILPFYDFCNNQQPHPLPHSVAVLPVWKIHMSALKNRQKSTPRASLKLLTP